MKNFTVFLPKARLHFYYQVPTDKILSQIEGATKFMQTLDAGDLALIDTVVFKFTPLDEVYIYKVNENGNSDYCYLTQHLACLQGFRIKFGIEYDTLILDEDKDLIPVQLVLKTGVDRKKTFLENEAIMYSNYKELLKTAEIEKKAVLRNEFKTALLAHPELELIQQLYLEFGTNNLYWKLRRPGVNDYVCSPVSTSLMYMACLAYGVKHSFGSEYVHLRTEQKEMSIRYTNCNPFELKYLVEFLNSDAKIEKEELEKDIVQLIEQLKEKCALLAELK